MLNKFVLILCLAAVLLSVGNVAAQDIQPDSSGNHKMRAYFEKHFSNPTDPVILKAADTLLQMARTYNDALMAKFALGAKLDYYYYGKGEHHTDSLIAWVHRVQKFAKEIDNSELYYWVWSSRLVNHYIKQGEYNIALIEAGEMLKEAEKEQSKASIAECYSSLANIYQAKGLTLKSQEFMLKEIELFEKYNVIRYHISFQYSDAAKIYVDQGENEKAIELLKKALKEAKSSYHEVTAKLVYVPLYLNEGRVNAAKDILEECRQMYDKEPSLKRHIHYFYDVEIDCYDKTGNYNAALSVLNQRERELKRVDNIIELANLSKMKADILWKLNRKEEAAALYRDYIEEQKKEKAANEEITTGEFATLLNLQQLNAEKGELEKISQEKELQNIRIILFSLTGILCVVVFFLYKQRKLNRKLKKSRDTLDEKNRILIEAEEELKKAKEAAEQSSWMKTVFIQNMSHEIRTPLNSIVGFSAVLADLLNDKEEIRQYASLIEENSNLLLGLIGNILDISALDNNTEITRSAIDVNNCCFVAVEKTQALFAEGVEVKFKPTLDKLIINSNSGRIVQVLENLLNNASKFTKTGSVTLLYEVNEKNKQVIFTVTDTGIGIPVEEHKRVFERFVKLNDFSQGTGLGLAISLVIAEKLGGYLAIDRTYTQGSRFIFCVAI